MSSYLLAVRRGLLAFAIGLLAKLVSVPLVRAAVSSKLEPWALASLVCGLFFGPAGSIGLALAFFATTVQPGSSPRRMALVAILGIAYSLPGLAAYATFSIGKGLRCGLDDLRSYLAFVFAVLGGSFALAAIGSNQLFPRALDPAAYWRSVSYWFSSSTTTLLILGPALILAMYWLLPAWASKLSYGPESGETLGWRDALPGRDLLRIAAMISAVTVVVVPILSYRPQLSSWFMLAYLVPILWASIRHGMQAALIAASTSGLAYLAGSELWVLFAAGSSTHDSVLGEYAGLVMIASVGAITGAFQNERRMAQRALVASKLKLEARNDFLQMVNGLADRLHRTLNVRSIAAQTVEAIVRLSNPPLVATYLLDQAGEDLELVAQIGFDEEVTRLGSKLPLKGSLAGLAVTEKRLVISENVGADERAPKEIRDLLQRSGIKSVVAIPILFEGNALGTIVLAHRASSIFDPDDLATLQSIGYSVAVAIVNARQLAELEYQAHHDSLTGLPNRLRLHRVFAEILAKSPRGGRIGLALLDLDRFKEVNDALGHRTGDALLKQIGQRLTAALSERELSAYRLGGDEFGLILPNLRDLGEAERLVHQVLESLRRPFDVGGMNLEVRSSVGVAVYPEHGADSHELLRGADVAMYQAKSSQSGVAVYSPDFEEFTPEDLRLASELRGAIDDDQLILHYQRKVDLNSGTTIGFESLVRWQHPRLGLLSPQSFVPLAEVGDLIHPLTDWVLETALTQLAIWNAGGRRYSMAVNLSARNLLDVTLADKVRRIIDRTGVDPACIEVELTETALFSDVVTSARTLKRITEIGVRVSIDDFGTGYSSLVLLKSLPIQALKIDRSFVTDLRSEEQSRAIVAATVELANNLGIGVVAEGVEDSETADMLMKMGCKQAQGFYFARPAPASEISLSAS